MHETICSYTDKSSLVDSIVFRDHLEKEDVHVSSRQKTCSTFLRLVENSQELEQYQKLVYKAFCVERKWLNPDDYPDCCVRDPYDNYSDMIMVERDREIVAGMRLVGDSHLLFPHEELSHLSLPLGNVKANYFVEQKLRGIKRQNIREVSRFASVGLGMRRHSMTIELVKGLHWFAQAHSVDAYFMVIDLNLLNLCQKIHIPIHRIGDDFYCEGSIVMPGILFPAELSTMRKNKRIWNHIINPEGISGVFTAQNIAA